MRTRGFLFAGALIVLMTVAAAAAQRGPQRPEFERVTAEIRALNIINQLNLTREQLERILPIAREEAAERADLERRYQAAEPALVSAAKQLRAELNDGFNSKPETEREWNRVHGPLLDMAESFKERHDQRVAAAMQILTPNQLELIAEYKPCVVPIKDYKDPARIGQAAASSAVEKALERVRELPEPVFERSRERRQQMVAERLRKYYKPEEMPAKVQEFEQAAIQVRAMSEVEFQAKKSEIAQGLAPPEHIARGPALNGRVALFLVSPSGLPILEHKREVAIAQARSEIGK
jgi:Spy/CpxP family protein refolding chaperone